ncbi:Uncharacterised protein [Bordetella pertussis]|nr:Uncharacterised protein [Bordetella pertussis]CFP66741.1 Uncharacterised protein [Bordetella pertussis]
MAVTCAVRSWSGLKHSVSVLLLFEYATLVQVLTLWRGTVHRFWNQVAPMVWRVFESL